MILRQRNSFNLPSSYNSLFDSGGSNLGPMDDIQTTATNFFPYNKELFDVVRTKIIRNIGFANPTNLMVNNDTKAYRQVYFNLTKHIKKNINFSDNVARQTNEGLFIAFTICRADGQPLGSQYVPQVIYTMGINYQFTDI